MRKPVTVSVIKAHVGAYVGHSGVHEEIQMSKESNRATTFSVGVSPRIPSG